VEYPDHIPLNAMGQQLLNRKDYMNIGWLEASKEKTPAFLDHSLKKEKNTVRIGIFGSSCTLCGGEKNTYPDFLQAAFKKADIHVEIINFGGSGYGFSQEYQLWELLGQKYNLDYVIFTIHDFPRVRDQSFSYRLTHWGLFMLAILSKTVS